MALISPTNVPATNTVSAGRAEMSGCRGTARYPEAELSDFKRTGDDMKITTSKIDRVFDGVITFVGRIMVAGFLSGLSSTSVVESKPLNTFLICVGMLACP
jgi:hypothetical protein